MDGRGRWAIQGPRKAHSGWRHLVPSRPLPSPPPPSPGTPHSRASTSTPVHQVIFSDFLIRLSPIQPEMGMMGTLFCTKESFQPTRTRVWRISAEISSKRSFCTGPGGAGGGRGVEGGGQWACHGEQSRGAPAGAGACRLCMCHTTSCTVAADDTHRPGHPSCSGCKSTNAQAPWTLAPPATTRAPCSLRCRSPSC